MRAFEGDHLGPILLEPGRADGNDAYVPARSRRASLQHLGARVNSVALEDRVGQPHLVPAQVRHHVLGDVGHALARHQCQGEATVHQGFSELGLRGVVVVEVDRRRVLRQQREPDVVGRRDRPAERVLVDVSHREILEETASPALFDGHFPFVIMRHSTLKAPGTPCGLRDRRGPQPPVRSGRRGRSPARRRDRPRPAPPARPVRRGAGLCPRD